MDDLGPLSTHRPRGAANRSQRRGSTLKSRLIRAGLATLLLVVATWSGRQLIWVNHSAPEVSSQEVAATPERTITDEDVDSAAVDPEQNLPSVERVQEPYLYHQLLNRPPPPRDLHPENWDSDRTYLVRSDPVESLESAQEIRADLLLRGGFFVIAIDPQPPAGYVLEIRDIPNRSQANKAKDVISEYELNAEIRSTQKENAGDR